MPQKKVNNMAERKNEAVWLEKYGRWQIKVQFDGERRTFSSSTPGRKGKIEAEKKADAWLTTGLASGNVRLGKLWDEYVADLLDRFGETGTSYRQPELMGRRYIVPRLQYKRISSITPKDWQDCIDAAYRESKARSKPLSEKTLKVLRATITSFWKYCRSRRIPIDYHRDEDGPLTIPRDAVTVEKSILTPDDVRTLFAVDTIPHRGKQEPCWYIHAWRLLVTTGLRPGELTGLQWEDISDTRLSVRRSVNALGEITSGKNKNARRVIELPAIAKDILAAQRQMLQSSGIISPWIFPAHDGAVSEPRNIYRQWQTYCRLHGMTQTSLYELRHTMISINVEMPEALLQQMVGHSRSMDTRGTYGHAIDDFRHETAQKVDTALGKIIQVGYKVGFDEK